MPDLVYQTIIKDLTEKINQHAFPDLKLPDERSLSEDYHVSRSSIKRALDALAAQGVIFKKRGSGTFVNPLYLKNDSFFHYNGSNLGITDSFQKNGQRPGIKLLEFEVVRPSEEIQQDLFLSPDDFVYKIKRLRSFDEQPFMIEEDYIPIKLIPDLNQDIVSGSIFNYLQDEKHERVTRSFLSISAAPSTKEDQTLLKLKPTEPVGLMQGIFFLENGTPFEYSIMRMHYQYMKYNTFVAVN